MVQTTLLAQEAAELLWETIAFQAGSENKVSASLPPLRPAPLARPRTDPFCDFPRIPRWSLR